MPLRAGWRVRFYYYRYLAGCEPQAMDIAFRFKEDQRIPSPVVVAAFDRAQLLPQLTYRPMLYGRWII